MYYKSIVLASIAHEACVLVYVGPSRQVRKVEVGCKILRRGALYFTAKTSTRLPMEDVDSINWEYQRLVEKATEEGYVPYWSKPATSMAIPLIEKALSKPKSNQQ